MTVLETDSFINVSQVSHSYQWVLARDVRAKNFPLNSSSSGEMLKLCSDSSGSCFVVIN